MPVTAIVGGVIGAGGAYMASRSQADASRDAQGMIQSGMNRSLKTQERMYQQGRADLEPYRAIGGAGMYSLAKLFGLATPKGEYPGMEASAGGFGEATDGLKAFMESPMFKLPMEMGMKGVEYARAKINGLQNPGTANELMKYGQTYASSQLQPFISTLMNIAGMGQSAATTGANTGAQVGANMGNTIMSGTNALAQARLGEGQAVASGWVGATNAITQGIGAYNNNQLAYSILNRQGSAYGPAPGGSTWIPNPSAPWMPAAA